MSQASGFHGDPSGKARAREWQVKYETEKRDKAEAYEKISQLEEELKKQDSYLKEESRKLSGREKQLKDTSLLSEERYVNMAEKLAEEQKGFYNQKKQHEVLIKQTADMAK